MTKKQLVMQFQAQGEDWNGKPLTVDGVRGPKTEWALAIADLPLYRRRINDALLLCHGHVEPKGDNRSPWIDERVRRAGGTPGDPWCAANVFCVLEDAGVECRRTMSAVKCLEQFPLIDADDVLPMDLFGWENPDGTGHVGFVAGYWHPELNVRGYATFEGNSNNMFRLCLRRVDGLQFRRVVDESFAANVPDGVVVVRQVAGTR